MRFLPTRVLLPVIAALALEGARPKPTAAQLAAVAELGFNTTYVWRGVRRSTAPVLQPSGFLSWQPRGWTVTTGVWSSIELGRASAIELTDAGRTDRLAELNYWVEAHSRWRALDLQAGTVYYDLKGNEFVGGRGNSWDTGEVYGAASLLVSRITTLGIGAFYDYSAIRGAFLQAEANQYVPIVGVHDIMVSGLLRAEAGASLGQEFDPNKPNERAYFRDNGITHIDLSAGGRVSNNLFDVLATLHWQRGLDVFTRLVTRNRRRDSQYWLSINLSFTFGPQPVER
jgi:hypothetical protein